ncbi:MAG: hypothetical protein ACRBDL_04780 [Alphaproteobacteria bacterium]
MDGQPFFFDENIFDDDAGRNDPNKPEYTAAQVEQIRREAFEEGKSTGLREAQQSKIQQATALLQKIEAETKHLFSEEEKRNKTFEAEAVHLCLSIHKKLFPYSTEIFGVEEFKKTLQKSLAEHNTPEKIKIELHQTMKQQIEDFIREQAIDLDKTVTLTTPSTLSEHEYRILWPEGGIIGDRALIAEKTFSLLKEALAEKGINVHDEQTSQDDQSGDIEKPNDDISLQEQSNG